MCGPHTTKQCGYSWSLFVTLHIWVNVLMSLLSNYFKEISHQIGTKWLSPKRTYREKGGQIWSVFGLFLRQLCFKQDEGRRKLETYLTVLTADAWLWEPIWPNYCDKNWLMMTNFLGRIQPSVKWFSFSIKKAWISISWLYVRDLYFKFHFDDEFLPQGIREIKN